MLRRFEHRLSLAGITKLDRVMAIGFYVMYILWFVTRIFDWVPPVDDGDLGFLYSDIINVVVCVIGLILAARRHFWLERFAAQIVSISTAAQTATLWLFLLAEGQYVPLRNLLLGVVFSFYFTMRAFGLCVRIVRARAALELRFDTPGDLS